MLSIIKPNITVRQATALFPNNWIVLAVSGEISLNSVGDLVFVGTDDEAWQFTENNEPPPKHEFFTLQGDNLRELAPIEVGA